MRKIILTLLSTASLASAAFTITGGAVLNLADENNVALNSTSTYAVLVALNNDPFDGLVMSDTISVGQTVGNGKYYVLQVGTTIDTGVTNGWGQQVNLNNFNTAGTPLAGNAEIGSQVAFVWFPGQSTGSGEVLNAGDVYGVQRGIDWVLPSDLGGSASFSSFVGTSKPALFIVAIPEPTGIVLLGLGAFALMARRRRD